VASKRGKRENHGLGGKGRREMNTWEEDFNKAEEAGPSVARRKEGRRKFSQLKKQPPKKKKQERF